MKKIGIITLNGYSNFGNRLQNYALTNILEKKGFFVDTIWTGCEISIKSRLKYFIISYFPLTKKLRRSNKFLKFTKKYINTVNFNKKKIQNYDIFVVGSDQVWNYESVKNNINYLVPFSTNQKLISYSASLGNFDFPTESIDIFKKYISRFDYISVREEQGKKILEKNIGITDKKISVLIDPTLLITKEQWSMIEKKVKKEIKNKYILCYFLGHCNEEYKKVILKYSIDNDMQIIDILNPNDPFYCSGPEEFIYLIHNSDLVCTDSFHSCVFSFIFNKPFVVFRRKDSNNKMYSRIENLLKTFKINDREFNGSSISKPNLNPNYENANKILNMERKRALKFIDDSLK